MFCIKLTISARLIDSLSVGVNNGFVVISDLTALYAQRLIAELKSALSEVRTLKELLPICASCKKVRDDQGYWSQIDVYLRTRAAVEFTHGICPDCDARLYGYLTEPVPE